MFAFSISTNKTLRTVSLKIVVFREILLQTCDYDSMLTLSKMYYECKNILEVSNKDISGKMSK